MYNQLIFLESAVWGGYKAIFSHIIAKVGLWDNRSNLAILGKCGLANNPPLFHISQTQLNISWFCTLSVTDPIPMKQNKLLHMTQECPCQLLLKIPNSFSSRTISHSSEYNRYHLDAYYSALSSAEKWKLGFMLHKTQMVTFHLKN